MSTLEQRLAARWRRQPYESGFSRLRLLVATTQCLATEWRRRARSRGELAQMSDHDLREHWHHARRGRVRSGKAVLAGMRSTQVSSPRCTRFGCGHGLARILDRLCAAGLGSPRSTE
jgi:uncharacterized protein YjiS (DUF1127 family)